VGKKREDFRQDWTKKRKKKKIRAPLAKYASGWKVCSHRYNGAVANSFKQQKKTGNENRRKKKEKPKKKKQMKEYWWECELEPVRKWVSWGQQTAVCERI
jgi:hypothetical protein